VHVRPFLFALLTWATLLGWPSLARAAPVDGPEINPFACQGQAEAMEADRSIGQIRQELEKKLDPLFLPTDPPTVRAIKLCVVGEMMKRVGDADAIAYYERAIATNPGEPGFEMFAGKYYGGARGAKGPVVEMAEKHYYRALEKLEKLQAEGRYRAYHDVVADHVRKGLLLLYQQDGLPLLPWKAYPQHPSGYPAPGLSIASQDMVSMDTRDGPGANEAGGFTAEAGLFVIRKRQGLVPESAIEDQLRFARFAIARNPLRLRSDNQLRLRHTYLGAIDLTYGILHAKNAALGQDQGFGYPELKHDVDVRELGAVYERVLPLYPLFDLRLNGGIKRVHRVGVVEYLPTCAQDFNVYEAKPSLSRFVTSDKLTIGGVYAFMDIPPIDCPRGPPVDDPLNVRGRRIAAVNFEYAFYSPVLLPSLELGSLRPFRTPTRGWYVYGGYVNDNEVFGDHRTINETFYGGSRLEGPGPFDIGVTESFYMNSGSIVHPDGSVTADSNLSAKMLRSSVVVARHLVNPDETPGVPRSWAGFGAHSLNWVFPASFDKVLSGRTDFENFRVGTQLWWQMFGTGIWGPAVLVTAGYDYQYFYHFKKHMHNVSLTFRVGWRDL